MNTGHLFGHIKAILENPLCCIVVKTSVCGLNCCFVQGWKVKKDTADLLWLTLNPVGLSVIIPEQQGTKQTSSPKVQS